jgi:hypothetical protein
MKVLHVISGNGMCGAKARVILRRFHAVVAVSRDVERRLPKAGVRKVSFIRTGIGSRPLRAIAAQNTAGSESITAEPESSVLTVKELLDQGFQEIAPGILRSRSGRVVEI